jgi:molybdopterin molybdotransferase
MLGPIFLSGWRKPVTQSVSVDEALRRIVSHRPLYQAVNMPLDACLGRILAEPLIARVSLPPAHVSAMDGFAVRLADTGAVAAKLDLIGEASAGTPFEGIVGEHNAVRIFTGGVMPKGADHVLIQEHADLSDGKVIVKAAQSGHRHIRTAGSDFTLGQTLIETGKKLGPADLGLAAAANHKALRVLRPPRIALMANGDELKPPGTELSHGQIVSSTPTALAALIRSWGFEVDMLGIAEDTIESLHARIDAGADADILVPIGGASVGDKDLVKASFLRLGFQPVFEKILVKPGKPTWFGTLGRQRVLGLPGNPAATFIGAALYLRTLIGLSDGLELIEAETRLDLPENGSRETFVQASLTFQSGRISVRALPRQSSAAVSGLAKANCLIRRAAGAQAVSSGDLVSVVMLTPLTE